MSGLLDFMNTDEARMGLGLLAAAGPRSDGAGFGQRMMEGIGYADQYKAGQQKSKYLQMQMDEAQAKIEQEKADRERQQAIRQGMGGFFKPGQQALAPLMGNAETGILPSAGRAAVAPSFDTAGAAQFLAQNGEYEKAQSYLQSLEPKERTLTEGQVVFRGDKPILSVPKTETQPSAVKEYQFAVSQGYKGTFDNWATSQKRAGASSIVNNLGDNLGLKPKDRFDMEDKMRNDYSTATKNDTEIISTAQDLKDILKQGGALKDQAAIYKFAKSLDPQGAVREADYAAIVKTAGGLDYVTSLVNKAVTGEQLSAKQRTEMTSLMDSMAAVAKQRVGKVQGRYGANAKMYNLKPENIFQQQTEGGDGWAIVPGAK